MSHHLGFLRRLIKDLRRNRRSSGGTWRSCLAETIDSGYGIRNALYLRNWFVLEAARADSGVHLWADFRFVLKKMGFCRAELTIGDVERVFGLRDPAQEEATELWQTTHRILGIAPAELTLYAAKSDFSEHRFEHFADIAAEAWSRAAGKWKEVNGTPLDFQATAREPETYRNQRMRAIYRPTY